MHEDAEMYVERLLCLLQQSVEMTWRFAHVGGTEGRKQALRSVDRTMDILGEVRRVLDEPYTHEDTKDE